MQHKTGLPVVVLSFDDGYVDNWRVARPILNDLNIKATFNIITSKTDVDGFMSREQLEILMSEGHEIAAHGYEHSNTREDILKSVGDLLEWGVVDPTSGVGFASPNSHLTVSKCNEMANWFKENDVLYVRTGMAENILPNRIRIKRKLLQLVKQDGGVLLSNKNNNPMPLITTYGLTSQVVVKNTNVDQIQNIIMQAHDELIVLMFHSILEESTIAGRKYLYSWSAEKFETLCYWLAEAQLQGEIVVTSTTQAIRKLKC